MLKFALIIATGLTLVLAAGCQEEGKSSRGLRYMPDMYDSPQLESQDAFIREETRPDGTVQRREIPIMQNPTEGTISRNYIPQPVDDPDLGAKLVNPLARTEAVLNRGLEKYNIYCAVCHGKDGNHANGYVASYLNGIISINTENVEKNLNDGQIYHLITHGRNRMPSYGAQLLPEDRWAVIHYLRALRVAAIAKGDEKAGYEKAEADGATERFVQPEDPLPEYERERYDTKGWEGAK